MRILQVGLKQAATILLVLLLPAIFIEGLDHFNLFDARYHRGAIVGGEWWRLLTGHLDHIGWVHLLMNGLCLALLLALFRPLGRPVRTLFLWLLASLLISLMMWFLSPGISWYVGLSASLYALVVYALATDTSYPVIFRIVALGLTAFKVGVEQVNGDASFMSDFISGPVAVDSHLYGVIAGVVLILIMRFRVFR
ncbi:rhombosortase [Alkalimarinus alittae]|uniref:Rhombosortase n=1 Tax=Alkalimarinus alittae TaxID=2961619 RepID=A0ABY6N0B1_9ALTE|nr:rhombosortase [Alkalimarinus alittae]UZE95470.1 rhombosortase [Alkalimarinus alittae]